MALGLVVGGALAWRRQKGIASGPEFSRAEREGWRMPALVLLERPKWSMPRRIAMVAMGAYLVVAVALLAVKAVQLALGL